MTEPDSEQTTLPDLPVPWTEDEEAVLAILKQHQGRENAIGRETLAKEVGLGTRVVEQIVRHLVVSHGQSIASSTGGKDEIHGYYMISSLEEQDQAERQLVNRIIASAKRLGQLRKNTPAEILGQIKLDLEQDTTGVAA